MYVMDSPTLSQYKIGTGDAASRLKKMRTGNPDMQFVAAVNQPSAAGMEKRLHSHFDHARVDPGLEWFHKTDDVEAWVRAFAASPGTANRVEDIPLSFPHPSMWPWMPNYGPELPDGQMALDVQLAYSARIGSGEGQTSAISEDWYTPRPYVEAVRELYGGSIDLDPASCAEANLTVRADNIYTAEMDGMRHPWFGRVYLNPPWGKGGTAKNDLVEKAVVCYERGEIEAAVLALNSNATTSRWFQPLFSYPICFPNHRVRHMGPGGIGGSPNSGTVFIYLGPDVDRFVQIFSWFGRVVPPAYNSFATGDFSED